MQNVVVPNAPDAVVLILHEARTDLAMLLGSISFSASEATLRSSPDDTRVG